MTIVPRWTAWWVTGLLLVARAVPAATGEFGELHWRCIGPFRGGRTVAAVGIPGRPHHYYIGVNNGGVWRTDDAGRTWEPLFDEQPTQSIGAIAIAPSDPRTIYVGSGEGLQRPDLSVGDGVYRSLDAGAHWTHLGLRDGQQIPALAVDPRDPRRVFAAVLGHPYGPNDERGVFRSDDGGEHWDRVLFVDGDTGAMDVRFDPADPGILYAVTWSARQPPWEGGGGSLVRPQGNGLWRSNDGGAHWRRVGEGLPGGTEGLGRIGLAVAPSRPGRLYAVLGANRGGGLYASDDRGDHWRRVNDDPRLWDRDGDFNEVEVDPVNPDIVYVANVVAWKSTDGGRHFEAWRGAPGGDDYHRIWIQPSDPQEMILAGDQGAVVTLNGGRTWSSWYNQPTAQLYHVATDQHFPYRVYSGQQESGSAAVSSRGDDGRIGPRDWRPVGIEEYGAVAPDPLHPDVVFGGKLQRFDWSDGTVQNASPDPLRLAGHRWVRTMPVVFSAADPRRLYLGANVVFESVDAGSHWRIVSPDLTREPAGVPDNLGAFAALDPEHGAHRGVVYALAPSPRRADLLWAGTDDGRIQVTHDRGKHWTDVTPAALRPWAKVSLLEASHTDTLEAWAAINAFRLDDVRAHVLRTRDGGRTWDEIVTGLENAGVVNAVREDPAKPGLLYAGTERGVWVSLDDGAHWRSLQYDLPRSSVRDLVVHDPDLVVATHGRSFWILDDLSPVRQSAEASRATSAWLAAPAPAWRVRGNRNTDTPAPPDEPGGENPPEGAILDYRIAPGVAGPVAIEIRERAGRLVRRFTSDDPVAPLDTAANIPTYWMGRPARLSAAEGAHRFVWDLREAPLEGVEGNWSMAAVEHDTPREPRGAWVPPGRYVVSLVAGGGAVTRDLEVRMDPRVRASAADLVAQHALARRIVASLGEVHALGTRARRLRDSLATRAGAPGAPASADSLARTVSALLGSGGERRGRAPQATFGSLPERLGQLHQLVEQADRAPTAAMREAADALDRSLATLRGSLEACERRAAAVR